MDDNKYHFIIMIKHLLIEKTWFIHDEFDGTEEECIDYMRTKDPKEYKIIKGNWCELQYEVTEKVKEGIYNKHSQGSAFNEQEDDKGTV